MWKVTQRRVWHHASDPFRLILNRSLSTATPDAKNRRGPKRKGESFVTKLAKGEVEPRLNRYVKQSKANNDHKSMVRLLESTKDFLSKASSTERLWTGDQFQLAGEILRTWPNRTIPKSLVSSWVQVADQLLQSLLHQLQSKETKDHTLVPDSESFCSLIALYSKSNLPDAAERADYWLQQMIHASESFPKRVTPPRATIFASVLSSWEKSNHPDAHSRAEALWKQLKSTNGIVPNSSAYFLYISLLSKSKIPEAAESILVEMIEEGKRNPKLIPSCPVFVNVITSWRRRAQSDNDGDSVKRAQRVLELLVEEYNRRSKFAEDWRRISINDVPFNAAIQTWATSSFEPAVIEENIQVILDTMEELGVPPTMVTAWSALPLYASREDRKTMQAVQDVPNKVSKLLDATMSNDGGGKNPMLRNQILARAMDICSNYSGYISGDSAAEVTEEILLRRYLKRPRRQRRVDTTITGFEHAIRAWRRSKSFPVDQKEKRLRNLLKYLKQEVDYLYAHTRVKDPYACKLYGFLAKAWAMSYYPGDSLIQAENALETLLMHCKETQEIQPSVFWFNDAIEEAKESYPEQVGEEFARKIYTKLLRNESLLHRIFKNLESATGSSCDASVVTRIFDGFLDSLVIQGDVESGRQAESILLKQQELYEDGICSPPTFETFKKVLKCWSYSEEKGAAERMENMLILAQNLYDSGDSRLRPDFEGFMTVISAWSTSFSSDAPERIQNHLRTLQQRRLEGDQTFRMDSRVYAALILAYANSGGKDAQMMADKVFQSTPEEFKDTLLYNVLIEAQGGDSNRAEALLQAMQLSYFEGNSKVKPNTESFNAVIQAWLRSGSPMAAWRVDGIFKQMEEMGITGKFDVKPNSRTFDLVISTLAQDWGAELAKVDYYLELLKEHYRAGDCTPTVTSYTEAIRAWASKNDDPRAILRAQALLDEMHELAREGVEAVRPNRSTYEVFLQGVSQSPVEDRSQLVTNVLFKMRENAFVMDNDMRFSIQRCLLPLSSRTNTWVIDVDDYISI